jgi:rSAM/selenodomain-associated transferase 1
MGPSARQPVIPSSRQVSRVLGLFAKRPRAGQVKTRLAAATSAEWAARVADAFLLDSVTRLAGVDADRVVVFAPAGEERFFAEVVGGCFALAAQADGDLGGRLAAFVGGQLAEGAAAVVVVGTDSPTLPPALVEQAFRELEQADVVLGPATDGGYYLVGCARRLPPVFEGISWGGRRVLGETVARLGTGAGRLAVLQPWYDVDTLDDWWMLCGHLAALRRAGIDPGLPRTEDLTREPPP